MYFKIKISIVLFSLMSCKLTTIKVENLNRNDSEINPATYNLGLKFDTINSFSQFLYFTKSAFKIDSNFKVDFNNFSYWFDKATAIELRYGQMDSNLFKKIKISGFRQGKKSQLWDIFLYKLKQDSFLNIINFRQFQNRLLNDSLLSTLIDTGVGYMAEFQAKKKYEYIEVVVFKKNNLAQLCRMHKKSRNHFQIIRKINCQYYIQVRTKELVLRFPSLNSEDEYIFIQDWIFKINQQSLILKCKSTFTENGPSYYLTSNESYVKVKLNSID